MRTLKDKARRIPMGMRVTPQMHERIVTAARESGRSITQEIELRLEVADLALRQPAKKAPPRRGLYDGPGMPREWKRRRRPPADQPKA